MRQAFTLIELVIAMAIGLVILLAGLSAVRLCSQTLKQVNRQAIEDSMLASGFLTAADELDYWRFYDDPDGDAMQGGPFDQGRALRQWAEVTGSNNSWDDLGTIKPLDRMEAANDVPMGGAFTPFAATARAAGGADFWPRRPYAATRLAPDYEPLPLPSTASTTTAGLQNPFLADRARGFDPHDGWRAVDPRTWYHGDWGQGGAGGQRFGYFAGFENQHERALLGGGQIPMAGGAFGTVDVLHTWRCNQLVDLRRCLGWYGLVDYLPTNTMTMVYGGLNNNNWTPVNWQDSQSGLWGQWPEQSYTRVGFVRYSGGGGVVTAAVEPSSPYADGQHTDYNASPLQNVRRQHGDMGTLYTDAAANWWDQTTKIRVVRPLFLDRPDGWPIGSVAISRYYQDGHFINRAWIKAMDPVTGKTTELIFTGLATTLRGARQQRAYDPARGTTTGWAVWRGPNDPRNDRTLDDH